MVSESYLAPPPDKGGRIIVESVAGWPWTGWPDARGLGGRMVVEFAHIRPYWLRPHPFTL